MGWKDTVMDDDQVMSLYGIHPHQLVPGIQVDELKSKQAEISYKAGTREVVEEYQAIRACTHMVGYHYLRDCKECEQAKLREWGIIKEGVNEEKI